MYLRACVFVCFCVCVCVRACVLFPVYGRVDVHMCTYVKFRCFFFGIHPPGFLIRLPSKTQWSSCLYLPNTGMTDPCHAWLYYTVSGSQAWVFMIVCEHLTSWVISLVLGKAIWKCRMCILEEFWTDGTKAFAIVLNSPAGGLRSCRLRRERGVDDEGSGRWEHTLVLP